MIRRLIRRLLAIAILAGLGTPQAAAAPWGAPGPMPPDSFLLERWELRGDRLLDDVEAFRGLPWAPGDSVPRTGPADVARGLQGRLRSAGWWGAQVTPQVGEPRESGESGRIVAFEVSAGEPVVVGEIEVRGNLQRTREEILALCDLRPGEPFREDKFRADVARVLRAYSELGYPRARVFPSGFRRTDEGRLAFALRISEGPAGVIESVRVFGNTTTLGTVVARIGGVRPGDRWSPRRVEAMAGRLRREGLFLSVEEPRVVNGSRDNLLGIEVTVEEGHANSVFGVLGYNPDPGGDGGEVVGLIDLSLRNVMGTARRASLRFERQAKDVQDIAFRYREPWVLGSPISAEVGAAQAIRDTLYSRTDVDLAIAFPIRAGATGRVAVEQRDTSFDDAQGERQSETSRGGSVAVGLDARDRPVNPGSGWRADLLVGFRETRENVGRTRGEVDGQVLLPLSRRWVVSEEAGFRGVWSSGGITPLYEQFFLGGTNTVRGYREEQFPADRVWWTRSELRWRIARRSRAYLLADVGGFVSEVATESGTRLETEVLPGGGFGVALETRGSGVVRFELAVGRGDSFSDAKVHVGLEQEF